MLGRVVLALAAAVTAAVVAGCGAAPSTPPGTDVVTEASEAPLAIPPVTGRSGQLVVLEHEAEAGDVFGLSVRPLPTTSCEGMLALEGPSGEQVDVDPLFSFRRLDERGTWTWTLAPCPGDRAAYTVAVTPTRQLGLEVDGPGVELASHETYAEIGRFEVPVTGRVVLVGQAGAVIGPDGDEVRRMPGQRGTLVFEDGRPVVPGPDGTPVPQDPLDPDEPPVYVVVGLGSVLHLLSSVESAGTIGGGPVELAPTHEDGVAADYTLTIDAEADTWVAAELTGWDEESETPASVWVEPLAGQPAPNRLGGLWHLAGGEYAVRVTPPEPAGRGNLELVELDPVRITGPGTVELRTGPGGAALALLDTAGPHQVDVPSFRGGDVPWTLTWAKDEPLERCVSALDCMSHRPPSIPGPGGPRSVVAGKGYLVLTSDDGEQHTVAVRVGGH